MKHHLSTAIFKTAILTLLSINFAYTQAAQLPLAYAKILNPLSGTIAQQCEANSANFYWRRDAQACSRHLTNLARERAGYNRRAQFARDQNLRDLFRDCSVHDLAFIFNYCLANGDLTELEIVTRYGLYTNPAFLAYITTLPGYATHINNLHSQAHHCKTCKKRVAKHMGFKDKDAVMRFLDDAQQRIDTARAEQLRRAQIARQQEILQKQQQQQEKALAQNQKPDSQKSISKKYEIRHTTQDLIEKYGIPARELTEFEGNQQQHVLHARFIDIMDSAADLDSAVKSEMRARSTNSDKKHAQKNKSSAHSYTTNRCFVKSCTALIIKSADIGIQSNKKGNTTYARKIANFCHVALDQAQNVVLDIAIGAGEGVYQGVINVGNVVLHPVDTATNIAHGAYTIVSCAYSTLIAAGSGEITVDFDHVYDLVIQKASQATVRGVARGTAEIVTETMLTGKLCGAIAEFIQKTQIVSRTARGAARAVRALTKEKPLYVTAEGIEVYLADGASGTEKAGKALSAESKGGNLAKRANILKSEMDSATGAGRVAGGRHGEAVTIIKKAKPGLTPEAHNWLEEMQGLVLEDLKAELQHLKKISVGKAEGLVAKEIKIAHEHILGMELNVSDKGVVTIGGFHHDPMRYVDTSGFFELVDRVNLPSGVYGGQLKYQGYTVKYEASFFPSHWSREKVVDKIYEAYNYFVKSKAALKTERDGKYLITGFTSEGIEIKMHMTKNGVITSAYPILK
jgi:hypothetical protein